MEERKLRCGDARFDPGGGGLKVARAVKRLGGEVTALLASGGAVGLSLSAGGVVYRDADSAGRVHAPSVPRRSAVGAGDSMVEGLVVALSRGAAFVDAVRFGVAAGSAAVMSSGTELCSRRDTEKLFERLRRSGS